MGIEDVASTSEITPGLTDRISCTKLQMIIVCPRFLEIVEEHSTHLHNFDKSLKPNRTIALLLGVNDDSLKEVHHKGIFCTFLKL